ncbi:hypothetical protein Tco_1175283 [Tanacetum coccineum]
MNSTNSLSRDVLLVFIEVLMKGSESLSNVQFFLNYFVNNIHAKACVITRVGMFHSFVDQKGDSIISNLRLSSLLLKCMIASAVCKNGLPRIRGTLLSSSMPKIMKSIGKMNFPTCTSIFLATSIGYWFSGGSYVLPLHVNTKFTSSFLACGGQYVLSFDPEDFSLVILLSLFDLGFKVERIDS